MEVMVLTRKGIKEQHFHLRKQEPLLTFCPSWYIESGVKTTVRDREIFGLHFNPYNKKTIDYSNG